MFPIWLKDTKTGYKYHGWAVATEKSSKIQVSMDYHKLQGGTKYSVIGAWTTSSCPDGWTKGKTFTVKK